MKNWWIPATVLGLSGLGLICASERGREQMKSFLDRIARNSDPLGEFSRFLDSQLDNIQRTLNDLSEALEEQQA